MIHIFKHKSSMSGIIPRYCYITTYTKYRKNRLWLLGYDISTDMEDYLHYDLSINDTIIEKNKSISKYDFYDFVSIYHEDANYPLGYLINTGDDPYKMDVHFQYDVNNYLPEYLIEINSYEGSRDVIEQGAITIEYYLYEKSSIVYASKINYIRFENLENYTIHYFPWASVDSTYDIYDYESAWRVVCPNSYDFMYKPDFSTPIDFIPTFVYGVNLSDPRAQYYYISVDVHYVYLDANEGNYGDIYLSYPDYFDENACYSYYEACDLYTKTCDVYNDPCPSYNAFLYSSDVPCGLVDGDGTCGCDDEFDVCDSDDWCENDCVDDNCGCYGDWNDEGCDAYSCGQQYCDVY